MQYVLVSYEFLTTSTYYYNWYVCFIFKFLLPVVKFEKWHFVSFFCYV